MTFTLTKASGGRSTARSSTHYHSWTAHAAGSKSLEDNRIPPTYLPHDRFGKIGFLDGSITLHDEILLVLCLVKAYRG